MYRLYNCTVSTSVQLVQVYRLYKYTVCTCVQTVQVYELYKCMDYTSVQFVYKEALTGIMLSQDITFEMIRPQKSNPD
jgi:hypothetical protein